MQERLVTYDRRYQSEYDFTLSSLEKAGILCAPSEEGRRLGICIATNSDKEEKLLSSVLEEVLLTGFKWRYYSELIKVGEGVEDEALLFCLLDFDSGAERRFFKDKIFKKSVNIHLDAIYNFGMREVIAVWESYARLVIEFYETYPERVDKVELIAYLLSLNYKKAVQRTVKYYVRQKEESILLQDIFFYRKRGAYIPQKFTDIRDLVEELFGKYEKV